eukprot:TRINITY_DN9929_c1_g1_i1.p1 TRINITY_DN9929_c1_g1~~TRINITY_DN9929_c1_g1_i1.p1  ORF type:complete len:830 (+),score=177.74 TRINITY_DN9929_c1_g1_i1:144-2492(+)
MPEFDLRPSIEACSSAICACVRSAEDDIAMRLLEQMTSLKMPATISTYRGAIAACEDWHLVLRLLEDMQLRAKLTPDAACFTAAVSECARGRQWELCLKLLEDADAEGVDVGIVAFVAALRALERASRSVDASQLLRHMAQRQLELNVVALSASVSAAEQSGHWHRAMDMYKQMAMCSLQPDGPAVGAAIGAAATGYLWQCAARLLRVGALSLEVGGLQLNSCITALGRGQKWRDAVHLVDVWQATADEVTFNAAISAAVKGRCWQAALQVLAQMPARSLQPGVIALSAGMSARGAAGAWLEALELMSRLQQLGKEPSAISFAATISACEKGLQWQHSMQLLLAARHSHTTASRSEKGRRTAEGTQILEASFGALLLACARASEWAQALSLWHDSESYFCGPHAVSSFSILLSECEQRGLQGEEVLLEQLRSEWLWAHGSTVDLLLAESQGGGSEACNQLPSSSPLDPSRWLVPGASRTATAGAMGAATAAGAAAAPYAKELRLLKHVLETAKSGDQASVCAAIESFGSSVLSTSRSWLKVVGDRKANILTAAACGAPPLTRVLEIGCYCGYSALRLAAALPATQVITMDVDPAHVLITRNIVAFAGLTPRSVTVWTGYSRELLPRIRQRFRRSETFGSVFMDQRGSRYHEDLELLESLNLLHPGAVLVADNVLKPGAPLLLWRLARESDRYCSQQLSVQEFAMPVEDWMSVAVVKRLPAQQKAEKQAGHPKLLSELHDLSDEIRARATIPGRGIDFFEWASLSAKMKQGLKRLGIIATVTA